MTKDAAEIRDALVAGVQTLGEKADVKARIPESWQEGAGTVKDHIADSVHEARERMAKKAKDTTQPLIGSDRKKAAGGKRRVKAAAVLVALSGFALAKRRRS